MEDAFKGIFNRPQASFYDDVILTDEKGHLLGLTSTAALVRLQHTMLSNQLNQTNEQRQRLAKKNAKLEQLTDELERVNTKLAKPTLTAAQPKTSEFS